MVYSYFDQAYLINMDKDTDRLAAMTERLGRIGLPFERIAALTCDIEPKNPTIMPAAFGCILSHLHVWLLMLERNQDCCLVIEDDALFRDDTETLMRDVIVPELRIGDTEPETWDWCYLGANIRMMMDFSPRTPHLKRAVMADQTHAYAIKRKAIRPAMEYAHRILANPVTSFDQFATVPMIRVFTMPIIAIQQPIWSYSEGKFVDRTFQYFEPHGGGPPGIPPFDRADFKQHCKEAEVLL